MDQFLTTQEVAALLRVRERKIYALVAADALPVRRVTGKLLFPKDEIENMLAGAKTAAPTPRGAQAAHRPLVMVGGHDPLLEWALRESRCGIAALLDGALDGITRMAASEAIAAGMHIPGANLHEWNVAAVKERFGSMPVVLIEWAKRTRGLTYQTGRKRKLTKLGDCRGLRFQSRQTEAGSELILSKLLENEGLTRADLQIVDAVERSETDLAAAIAMNRADVGLGVEAMARQLSLEFTPLVVERFDLLVWRKDYFDPPFQTLLRFCASHAFHERAKALRGYDTTNAGAVHFNAN